MSVIDRESEELQRFRMSWEEYLALPEDLRAEWVDGEVVVSPRPASVHAYALGEVVHLFKTHLPRLITLAEGGVWLPRNRLRGPDVMLVERWPKDGIWVSEPAVLVVEVLSRATRSEDTIRKSAEYLEGGVGQYWMLDPDRRVLDVLVGAEDGWEQLLRLDDGQPAGEVVVAAHGTVPVDLRDLLR